MHTSGISHICTKMFLSYLPCVCEGSSSVEVKNPVASVAQPNASSSEFSAQLSPLSGKLQLLFIDLGGRSTSLLPRLQRKLEPLLYMPS